MVTPFGGSARTIRLRCAETGREARPPSSVRSLVSVESRYGGVRSPDRTSMCTAFFVCRSVEVNWDR